MKKVLLLLLPVLFCNVVMGQHIPRIGPPKDTTAHFFGSAKLNFQSTSCFSPAQRAAMEAEIKRNQVKFGLDKKAANARLAAHPLFVLPMKKAAGFTDPDFYVISNYVDLNPAVGSGSFNQYGSTNQDYTCGNRSYDQSGGYNHTGIDFSLYPFAWYKMANNQVEVIAAAEGTIVQKTDGYDDQSCGENTGPIANTIVIQHADGSKAYYLHLKKNSFTSKTVGQTVAQGEFLGIVGSSGFSTGPHLHFEVVNSSNNVVEPFFVNGGCNSTTSDSWWQSQVPYSDKKLISISIHRQHPIEGVCPPANNNPNFLNDVLLGETPKLYAWGKFSQTNDPITYTLLRPNGTVYSTTNSVINGNYNTWVWYSNAPKIKANEPTGEWTYRVVYNGQTVDKKFNVIMNTPKKWYVNAAISAGGNGTSWEQAFKTLQEAIDVAFVSDEVWVAKGTYYPTKDRWGSNVPSDARTKTFFIDKEIRILGGFAGNETVWNSQNIAANPTILSGDLGTLNSNTDNAYNVLYFYQTLSNYFTAETPKVYAALLGFTVKDGNADGTYYKTGAGVFVDGANAGNSSEPHIGYCTFQNNIATNNGGAIYYAGYYGGKAGGWVDFCTFNNNQSTFNGGAIYGDGYGGTTKPLITNSTFTSNSAQRGGAICNSGSGNGDGSASILGCTFTTNAATVSGGAIYNEGYNGKANAEIRNCTFTSNTSASKGGAIYNYGNNYNTTNSQSNATIIDCNFTNNSATNSGGAIYNDGGSGGMSNSIISNCKFAGNNTTANSSLGGAIVNYAYSSGTSSATISNVHFISNTSWFGGAIYNDGSSSGHANPIISGSLFKSNNAVQNSGAVYNFGYTGETNPTYKNCIFSQNSAASAGVSYNGGGNGGQCNAKFMNCTFWNNSATNNGGILYNDGTGGQCTLLIMNSIIWANTAASNPVFASYSSTNIIGYSLVQAANCAGLGTGTTCGAGMVYNQDPQFLNTADLDGADDVYGTSDDGLTIKSCVAPLSPAANTGASSFNSVAAPTTDISGFPRPNGAGYDMGAYERAVTLTIDTNLAATLPASSIISQNTITVSAPLSVSPVYLKAGGAITLNPGFSYTSSGGGGQLFKAEIGTCY